MPRAHCPKLTGPEPVASWQPVTGPPIGQSGPLAVVTGNRPVNRAAGTKARVLRPVARCSGPFQYRVKNRRKPPKNRDFRAVAHAVPSGSMGHVSRKYLCEK